MFPSDVFHAIFLALHFPHWNTPNAHISSRQGNAAPKPPSPAPALSPSLLMFVVPQSRLSAATCETSQSFQPSPQHAMQTCEPQTPERPAKLYSDVRFRCDERLQSISPVSPTESSAVPEESYCEGTSFWPRPRGGDGRFVQASHKSTSTMSAKSCGWCLTRETSQWRLGAS